MHTLSLFCSRYLRGILRVFKNLSALYLAWMKCEALCKISSRTMPVQEVMVNVLLWWPRTLSIIFRGSKHVIYHHVNASQWYELDYVIYCLYLSARETSKEMTLRLHFRAIDVPVVFLEALVVVFSHIQRIGCQPEKTTLHSGESRSWSVEQGKENKRRSLAAYPPHTHIHCSFGEK